MPNRSMQAKHAKGAQQRALAGADYANKIAMYATRGCDHVALVSCLARQDSTSEIGGRKVSREIADRIATRKSIVQTHW